MKRLEKCAKAEGSYHKIDSDTDYSPNNNVTVVVIAKNDESEPNSTKETLKLQHPDEVCQIWQDFDKWISNHFPSTSTEDSDIICESSCLPSFSPQSCNTLTTTPDQGCSYNFEILQETTSTPQVRRYATNRSNFISVSPCLVSIFIVIFTSLVTLVIFLWLSRFKEDNAKLDGSGPITMQNWWSPRPYYGNRN